MTRIEKIMPLADGTRSRSEVAKELGMSQRHLYKAITFAKAKGYRPIFKPERNGDDPLYIKVANALKDDPSLTSARLAVMLGVSRGAVTSAVSGARARGFPVAFRVSPGAGSIINQLPPDVAKWLRKQVPKGSTEVDLIRAIIIDAYHEDVENN